LFAVIEAQDSLRLGFGFAQGWQQHRGQYRYDRDYDQ